MPAKGGDADERDALLKTIAESQAAISRHNDIIGQCSEALTKVNRGVQGAEPLPLRCGLPGSSESLVGRQSAPVGRDSARRRHVRQSLRALVPPALPALRTSMLEQAAAAGLRPNMLDHALLNLPREQAILRALNRRTSAYQQVDDLTPERMSTAVEVRNSRRSRESNAGLLDSGSYVAPGADSAQTPDTPSSTNQKSRLRDKEFVTVLDTGRIVSNDDDAEPMYQNVIKMVNKRLKAYKHTVLPDSFIRVGVDTVCFFSIVFVYGFFMPYSLNFYDEDWIYSPLSVWLEMLLTVILLGNIVLNHFTAFRSKRGTTRGSLVMHPLYIAQEYRRKHFWLDLVPWLPLDLILIAASAPPLYIRCFRYVKVLHLFNGTKHFSRMVKGVRLYPGLLKLLNLVVVMYLSVHWVACFYWGISSMGLESDWSPGEYWLGRPRIERYLRSYYWAVVVITQGTNPGQPQSVLEFVFNIACIIGGVVFYATLFGTANRVIDQMDRVGKEWRAHCENVHDYLVHRNVPLDLRKCIVEYMEYVHAGTLDTTQHLVLDGLHDSLRTEVSYIINKSLIESVPLFRGVSRRCVSALVELLQSRVYLPGEMVIILGTVGDEMYFAARGKFEVWGVGKKDGRTILSHGMFFGEQAILQPDAVRSANVESLGHGELLVLAATHLRPLIEHFECLEIAMQKFAPERFATSKSFLEGSIMLGRSIDMSEDHDRDSKRALTPGKLAALKPKESVSEAELMAVLPSANKNTSSPVVSHDQIMQADQGDADLPQRLELPGEVRNGARKISLPPIRAPA